MFVISLILLIVVMAINLIVIKNPDYFRKKGWSIQKYWGLTMVLNAITVVFLIVTIMSMFVW